MKKMIPGEFHIINSDIELNVNRKIVFVSVINSGDRPIQVGSHFHFYSVNIALQFNRVVAWGFRLNIPSGMSIRFEPGQYKIVKLVQYSGNYGICRF